MQVPSQYPPGQLTLCFSRVTQPDRETEQSLLAQFSESERDRLDRIKSPSRRLEYLSSRILMRQALKIAFGKDQQDWQFEEQAGRFPLAASLPPGFHFNLSHSKGLICFALADMPIGIDIEACERQRDFGALAKLFMNESERAKLAALTDPANFFYRCWCVKEAYYKAQPLVDQETLHFTGIAVDDIDGNGIDWHLTEGKIEDHYLAAACRQKPSRVSCHYFPNELPWRQPFTQFAD